MGLSANPDVEPDSKARSTDFSGKVFVKSGTIVSNLEQIKSVEIVMISDVDSAEKPLAQKALEIDENPKKDEPKTVSKKEPEPNKIIIYNYPIEDHDNLGAGSKSFVVLVRSEQFNAKSLLSGKTENVAKFIFSKTPIKENFHTQLINSQEISSSLFGRPPPNYFS